MLYISSDHGGFELKNKLVKLLQAKNMELVDMGPAAYKDGDDYPDYTVPLVRKVLEQPNNKGIVICKNGVGVNMLANKFKGIRAALAFEPNQAASARTDDDTNILALPANYISEDLAAEIVINWLATPFSNEDRHKKRLKKVSQLENL